MLILRRALARPTAADGVCRAERSDYGDTVEQAAIRELQEETSLHATNLRFLFYQDSLPPAAGRMHCLNLYLECSAEGESWS